MKANVNQIKSGIMINATCFCENGKYLAIIIDNDSVITCGNIEKQKLLQQILMTKKICKTENLYILPACLLDTIAFLIAVSIYSYLIKN